MDDYLRYMHPEEATDGHRNPHYPARKEWRCAVKDGNTRAVTCFAWAYCKMWERCPVKRNSERLNRGADHD